MKFAMEYESERLILKILTSDYAQDVLHFVTKNRTIFEKYEPTMVENYYTIDHQATLLTCELQLALKTKSIRYYVFLKEDPCHIIGTVCLHNICTAPYFCCELGYKFDADYHHHGYAREAVSLTVSIAFHALELHRVSARVMPENTPSIHLLKSLPFIEEGLERECTKIQNQWKDHLRFSMINPF